MSTSKALAAAAGGRASHIRVWEASARVGANNMCAWSVALDRVRVIVWSQLVPRISLRKRIHKEVKALGLSGYPADTQSAVGPAA